MAQFQNEVDENYAMADFEDDSLEKSQQLRDEENSNDEDELDDFDSDQPTTDTSALEARTGKDIQCIPWERMKFTRDKYREIRLKQYKNYVNFPQAQRYLEKECKEVESGSTFYHFQLNTRLIKPTIVHFQPAGGFYFSLA